MPKSYADLLREAREQVREVTAQEVDALDPGTTIVDVREASEWEQGYIPGANHVSKSYATSEPASNAICAAGVAAGATSPEPMASRSALLSP